MRLVRGTDLHRLLQDEGPLLPARAAAIVAQVAAALDAAHASGLVHRDVKPGNVLLDGGDHAYLTDFGLTRLADADTRITETGRWMGTVDFASPEQLRADRTDARSDVFALGCVLYAALTGTPPFLRDTVPATIDAVLREPAPPGPPGFERVFARALAKDPAARYPSAGDLGRAAVAAARGEHVTEEERTVAMGAAAPSEAQTVALPAPPPLPITHQAGRWRARAALGGLALSGLAAVTALAIAGAGGTAPPPAVEPVTDAEVRLAVDRFSHAYATEDARALSRVLTRDVVRVLPGGRQQGRSTVVREYARQFRAMDITAYDVSDLSVQSGDAGRAEGDYTVRRRNAGPFGGHFVLGVVKERGRVRVRLIAAVPS
jgi:serine/threonine-protein kinase